MRVGCCRRGSVGRSVAWEYPGTRTRSYAQEAVNIAAEVDQHLSERVKLWLDCYVHAPNTLPVRPGYTNNGGL